jgi:competence protein ComEA
MNKKLKSIISINLRSICHLPHSMRYLSLDQQKILFLLALLILGLLYFKFYYHPTLPPEERLREVVIEVKGEIEHPGIHLFRKPPDLKEVIEKAGGLKKTALFDIVSPAETLETGTLLTVEKESPDKFKINLGRMESNKLLVFSIPLDLNRVSVEDLCLVPGIGESLAQEMVSYRQKRRGFRSIEELKNVKGIGEKKYQSLRTFFTLTP